MTRRTKRKLIIFLIFIFIAILISISWKNRKVVTTMATTLGKGISLQEIEGEISSLKQLLTSECTYSGVGRFSKSKSVFGKSIGFTESSFTIGYKGVLKAGVNLDKVSVQIAENIIYIVVPKSKIVSNELLLGSIQVFDEKESLVNNLNITDITSMLNGRKEEAAKKATKEGFLDIADKKAKEMIEKSIKSLLITGNYKRYRVIVATEKESE